VTTTALRQRIDLRLAVPAVTAWGSAAVTQTLSVGRGWTVAAAAGATALMLGWGRRRVAAAAGLGVAAGAASMTVHVAALQRGPVALLSRLHGHAEVALRLVRDPVTVTSRSGRRLVVADATATAVRSTPTTNWEADHAPVVVFALGSGWLGLLPGQRITVTGRLAPPRAGDTVSAVLIASESPRLVGRPPPWQRWAGRIRDALRSACAGLPADQRGLVPGLVLGDVAAMPPSLTRAFRVTGLTHLNAVSGANVAIVLGAVIGGVRWLGVGRRLGSLVAVTALLGFVILVRPSPSVLRAAVMGLVVLAASLLARRTTAVPVLAAAVLALLLVDPFLARTPGFAMSVLATAAIVVLGPVWTDRLATVMPRSVAAAVAVPAAAQLACTPVIVAAFGQLTPLAVPANLLAAPAVAPATLLGIGCALIAVVGPAFAAALAQLAGMPAAWLALVARTLAGLPGAGLRWPTGWLGLALLVPAAVSGWGLIRLARWSWRRAMLGSCRP
jgi:competence protein ComEC